MSDETTKAWNRIARALASELPGDWTVGRSGIARIIVRKPVDWVLVWAGLDRIRRDSDPYLIGGEVPLVDRFQLSVGHGIRSDQMPNHPRVVNLLEPTAPDLVLRFVSEHLLPRVEPWTPDRLAAEAEAQLAVAADRREPPMVFASAAGWRVVNDNGSPVEPATQAVAWYENAYSPDDAAWYRELLQAWETGGRSAALGYLEDERRTALTKLKLEGIQG